MQRVKQLIIRNFESFSYFYRQLRYRIFLVVGLSIGVGVLDGFGLSMFLPLLQMVDGNTEVSGKAMGKLGFLVDGLEKLGITLDLFMVLLIMVLFFAVKGLCKYASYAYRTVIRQYFIRRLREQILKSFNHLRYKYFVTADVGRIQNTMTGEVERVSRSFQEYFRAIEQGILVLVYMGFAFFVDARFALLVTIGGWLTNFLYKIIYSRTKGASKKFTKDSHRYQGEIIQHIANFKYLKATALLPVYAKRLQKSVLAIEYNRKYIGILNAMLEAAREPLLIVVVAAVILIQTTVLNAPLGPILISLLFFYRALSALVSMQNSWNKFLEVSGSLENVIDFQNEIRKEKERNGQREILSVQSGLILDHISFGYGDELVLDDIDLNIRKYEAVAFVGESGSGKTTLVNILAGLMPVDSGQFLIDGIDRQDLDVRTYQKRIGYITQEPVIFSDTTFNNVTFWAEPTAENLARFKVALKRAAIDDFVFSQPLGAETLLGNNGINLSGGQKQRISIARELYKDIDILIMDEATSALDTETERAIQSSIDSLKGEYTLLIVAHRLSTIKNADRIVIMKNGQIESIGGYAELMEHNYGFKRMVELQEL